MESQAPKFRLLSDGTSAGTHMYHEDGTEVLGVQAVCFYVDASAHTHGTVEVMVVNMDQFAPTLDLAESGFAAQLAEQRDAPAVVVLPAEWFTIDLRARMGTMSKPRVDVSTIGGKLRKWDTVACANRSNK
jgi:hypothetical protein